MPRIPLRFLVVSAILICLNVAGLLAIREELLQRAAAPSGPARLVSTLPAHDVDAADRLSLVLDRPVVEQEALEQPLKTAPFSIRPEPDGHWIWAAPNRLDFVLDKPLPAATEFRIRPAVPSQTEPGRIIQVSGEATIETRPLKLKRCELQSSDRKNVTFELQFNQEVDPDVLLHHMRVVDAKRSANTADDVHRADDLKPVALVRRPDTTLVIRCQRPDSSRLRVVLKPELTGTAGERPLGTAISRTLDVGVVFTFLRASVDEPGLDQSIRVRLQFSKSLDPDQTLPKINVRPAVKGLERNITRLPYSDTAVLRLQGRFEPGRRYFATLPPTLLSADGKTLEDSVSVQFEIPDRSPTIQFTSGSGILTPYGNTAIELESVNVTGVRLSATRVHSNNIVAHLQGEYSGRTSRPVAEQEVELSSDRNMPSTTMVDLKSLFDQPVGVYRVRAAATDHTWTSDSTIVTVTDLALTAKRGRDHLMVWVTSLRTATPQSGVTVSAVSYNNQVLARAVTDADGIATLKIDPHDPDGGAWVVLAEHEFKSDGALENERQPIRDLAYLRLDHHQWMLDDVDQTGRNVPITYDVMLYADRGVYRPGEVIHLSGLIRDTEGNIPPAFPLSLSVTRPDGREVATLTARPQPNRQGSFQIDFPTRDDSQTGPYVFWTTLPGADETLGQTHVFVEAFQPVRLEVIATPAKKRFSSGDPCTVAVRSRYLFGQPAARLRVQSHVVFERRAFVSTQFPEFSFDDISRTRRIEEPTDVTQLNANGEATLTITPPAAAPPGLWMARMATTVTETGGRSVSANSTFDVDTAKRHIGIKFPAGSVVPVEEPIAVRWVQQTDEDKPASPGVMDVELLQVEYDSVLRRVGRDRFWQSVERTKRVWSDTVGEKTDVAEGDFVLKCPAVGNYRVIVTDRETGARTRFDFYATRGASATLATRLDQPDRLTILLDKAHYIPGETVRATITSPFAGTLLLCLETDRVIDRRVVSMAKNVQTLDMMIPADVRGGAYLTASVVRAVDPKKTRWLPHRARGMTRVVTNHVSHRLPVEVHAAEQAAPGDAVLVQVTTRPVQADRPAPLIHLWAVDEGILLASAFQTPDPLRHFLGQRRSVLTSSDVYGDLLPDFQRPVGMKRIGADRDLDSLRRNPVPTTRATPAVIWQTAAIADADGRLNCKLTLPDFIGELRWMAVAVDGDSYGKAERSTTLTRPLLIEAAWPRFAAPRDQFQVPVKLFNSTSAAVTVRLTVDVDGPLKVTLAEQAVTVEPNRPHVIWLDVTATGIGPSSVTITAAADLPDDGAVQVRNVATLPIRPAGPLHTASQVVKLDAGKQLTLHPLEGFLPLGLERNVVISARPAIQMQAALDRLIDYPYGCVEQTASRILSLLAARDLLEDDAHGGGRRQAIEAMIDAGIGRLWSLQTTAGGLGYWPGATYPDPWGTAYATRVLVRAKEHGFHVDSRFFDELIAYLKSLLSDYASDENRLAQICSALADCDQPEIGWMSRLAERVDLLDMEGRADLASAWNRSGFKTRALAALPDDTITQVAALSTQGRLTSPVRQEARLLDALFQLDADHAWIPTLARRLNTSRKEGHWGNTLEDATAVWALTQYQLDTDAPGTFHGTALVDGETKATFAQDEAARFQTVGTISPIQITSEGTGSIYVTATTRGLLDTAATADFDRQLKTRRTWTDALGKPVDLKQLHVGDLIHVEVTLQLAAGNNTRSIANVAIVDALPGGLEVENPRLSTSAAIGNAGDADYVEFLDDRVVVFATATRHSQVFRYALRVTTAGSFALPPIQASCMYNEGAASLSGSGRIEVRR